MNDIRHDIEMGGGRPVNSFVCPPEFWPALGYDGDARYVAIWWEPGGDEACWSDGRQMTVGAEWPAYLALIDHNFPFPADPQLGGSDESARFWLVVDRHTFHDAWLVPAAVTDNILRGQWPAEDPAGDIATREWSLDEFLAAISNLPAIVPLTTAEIEHRMQESARRYEAFVAALDKQE